jgi:hypothetical protein
VSLRLPDGESVSDGRGAEPGRGAPPADRFWPHAYFKQFLRDKPIDHRHHVTRHGDDMPEVKDWRWDGAVSH